MKGTKVFAGALLLAASFAGGQDANLGKVLSQMDASSGRFQDVQANISVDNYTAVVQDHEIQAGTTAFRRANGSMEMVMTLDKGQPGEKDLLYRNGELDVFSPNSQPVEIILSAGANRTEYDSLLATGFGASGKGLAAAWDITFQGMETIDGVQTAKLDLVSKQANVRSNFSHITIWVDPARDISLKIVMLQPDGDTRTATYSSIRYNTHLADKLFRLDVPKGTPVQRR